MPKSKAEKEEQRKASSVFERFEIVEKEGWYVFKDRKWRTLLESDKGTIAFKTHSDAVKYLQNFFYISR